VVLGTFDFALSVAAPQAFEVLVNFVATAVVTVVVAAAVVAVDDDAEVLNVAEPVQVVAVSVAKEQQGVLE